MTLSMQGLLSYWIQIKTLSGSNSADGKYNNLFSLISKLDF